MKVHWSGAEYVAEFSPEEKAARVAYFQNPVVVWFEGGTSAYGGPLPANGYYVIPHCGDIHCCPPYGPFQTADEARDWSRENGWLRSNEVPDA
jgi:hypothetical protein